MGLAQTSSIAFLFALPAFCRLHPKFLSWYYYTALCIFYCDPPGRYFLFITVEVSIECEWL